LRLKYSNRTGTSSIIISLPPPALKFGTGSYSPI